MQITQAVSKTMTKSYYNIRKESWSELKNKLEMMKQRINPRFMIEELGFKIERETPKELRCACIIHGGDNKTAFRFNKSTNTWVCFTHKCHEKFGNDIIGLIRSVTGYDFMGAIEWLTRFSGDVDYDGGYVRFKRGKEMQAFVDYSSSSSLKHRSVNEYSLKDFAPLRSKYFIKKGFKSETLDFFEVAGGWKDSEGIIRDIIPIRDDKGDLVAYSLRDVRTNIEDEDNKYILTPGFNKDGCLYNLFRAQKFCSEKPLILVEGFKSVWKLHELGIDNVAAVMGSSITEGQKFLLFMYALKGIVIFFDNDAAGVEGTVKALSDLSSKMNVSPVFIQERDEKTGKGFDPADLSVDLLYEYLKNYY